MKLVNKRTLAALLGKSERVLTEWQREGLPFVASTGRGRANHYQVPRVIDWLVARELAKQPGQEGDRQRLARLQGDMLEITLAEKRGELIPASIIEPAWAAMVINSRQSLLSMPARVAPMLASISDVDQTRELLDEQVHDALKKLAPDEREPGTVGTDVAGPQALGPTGADPPVHLGGRES